MTVLHVAAVRGLDGMLLMFYSGSAQTVDRIHQVVNLKDKVPCMCCVKYVNTHIRISQYELLLRIGCDF